MLASPRGVLLLLSGHALLAGGRYVLSPPRELADAIHERDALLRQRANDQMELSRLRHLIAEAPVALEAAVTAPTAAPTQAPFVAVGCADTCTEKTCADPACGGCSGICKVTPAPTPAPTEAVLVAPTFAPTPKPKADYAKIREPCLNIDEVPKPVTKCKPRQNPLIIVAGEGKTGTESLATALGMMGLKVAHFDSLIQCCEVIHANTSVPNTKLYGIDTGMPGDGANPVCLTTPRGSGKTCNTVSWDIEYHPYINLVNKLDSMPIEEYDDFDWCIPRLLCPCRKLSCRCFSCARSHAPPPRNR